MAASSSTDLPTFEGAKGVVEEGDKVGQIQLQLNHLSHSFTASIGVLQRDAPALMKDESLKNATVSLFPSSLFLFL